MNYKSYILNPKLVPEKICPITYEDISTKSIKFYLNGKLIEGSITLLKKKKVVDIKGKLHYIDGFDVIKTKDSNRYYLKKDAFYDSYDGNWYESDKDLIMYNNLYYHKKNMIKAYDTKRLIPSNRAYEFRGNWYELRESFNEPSKYYFNYTTIPKDINERCVGLEYEFHEARSLAKKILFDNELREKYMSIRDGSLDHLNAGYEFVSIPLKINDVERQVDRVLSLAKKAGAETHEDCGFHVHISAKDLNFHDIASIVGLCRNVEEELLSHFPIYRLRNNYCRKLTERFDGFIETDNKNLAGRKLYRGNNANFKTRHNNGKYIDTIDQRGIRYFWLNLDRIYHKRKSPEEKTVEFRIHESTFDKDKFIGFVYLCYYIVEFGKNKSKTTAVTSSLNLIVNYAKPKHRKYILNFLNSK